MSGPVRHPDLAEKGSYRQHLEDLLARRGIQTAQPLEFGSLLMLVTAPALRRMDDLDIERDLKIIVFRRGCDRRQKNSGCLAACAHTASGLPENWHTEWRLGLCRSSVGCLPVNGNSHESFSN